MKTVDYLTTMGELYWPGVIAGLAIAVLCAWLSVLVVLKRLAFVGQGVSHAAFGGIGLAAVVGLAGAGLSAGQALAQFALVAAFCTGAALLVGALSRGHRHDRTQADTAIGVILVVSMAMGSILARYASSNVSWESFLFGSLTSTGWPDAAIALAVAFVVLLTLWFIRRPLVFWAFDEPAAESFGVRTGAIKSVLMVLLALATVTAMKLAGVVLASALLILPGAAALRVSARSTPVLVWSLLIAVGCVAGGLVLSFEADWPPGPSVVTVLAAVFALAQVVRRGN